MKKRVVSVVITVCLVLTLVLSVPTAGQAISSSAVPDGYIGIYTAEDLKNIENNLSGKYILMNDIRLVEEWEPIGSGSWTSVFSGTFDGNGHSITNMNITNDSAKKTRYGSYAGLFAEIESAYIANICVQGKIIIDAESDSDLRALDAGGIAGISRKSVISNCSNYVDVQYKYGIPSDQVFTAASGIAFTAGGIVGGVSDDDFDDHSTFSQCANYGTISGISDCAPMRIGGIIGDDWCWGLLSISDCYNAGNLSVKTGFCSSEIGGILGQDSISSEMRITNCYNNGVFSMSVGQNSLSKEYIGGIAGNMVNTEKCIVTNCIYRSEDEYANGNTEEILTRVPSHSWQTNINKLYWIMTNVRACSLVEMRQQSTYSGFDFSTVWKMGGRDYMYPILQSNRQIDGSVDTRPTAPRLTLLSQGPFTTSSMFDISWTSVAGATSYTIKVLDSYGRVDYIDSVSYADRVYQLGRLSAGNYTIQVSAITAQGIEGEPSNTVKLEIQDAGLEETIHLSLLNQGELKPDTILEISWTGIARAVTYNVEVMNSQGQKIYSAQSVFEAQSNYKIRRFDAGEYTIQVTAWVPGISERIKSNPLNVKIYPTAIRTPMDNLTAYKKGYAPSDSYKQGGYYDKLQKVVLSGNMQMDFVNIAKSQIGYHEGAKQGDFSGNATGPYNNYTEYGRYVSTENGAWCGYFAYWCARAAGADNNVYPKDATGSAVELFKSTCEIYSWGDLVNGYFTPQAGDIIIYKGSSSAALTGKELYGGSHVEILYDYRNIGGNKPYQLSILGGNYSQSIFDRGTHEFESTGKTSDTSNLQYIYAFVRPNWNFYSQPVKAKKVEIKVECPIDIKISKGTEYIDSATNRLFASFGSLQRSASGEGFVASLDYDTDYDVVITGNGNGSMDLMISYYDTKSNLLSHFTFQDVGIADNYTVTTSPLVAERSAELYVEDASNKSKEAWRCESGNTATKADKELTKYYRNPLASIVEGGQTIPSIVFSDVDLSAYYAEAVAWAVAQGITNGTSSTTFSPNNPCTRGQIVTFLWNAVGKPEPQSTTNPFVDVKPGDYFYKPVLWAVENQITAGTDKTHFSPSKPCTRDQAVTFLWRSEGEPAATQISTFTDVKAGSFYEDAVNWAVENKITSGTGKNRFSPKQTCTRGQIVTFLYRAKEE